MSSTATDININHQASLEFPFPKTESEMISYREIISAVHYAPESIHQLLRMLYK